MYDKDELKAAAVLLMRSPDAENLHTTLVEAVSVSRKLPIRLTGFPACMNPLLWLAQTDYPSFEKVMEQVDLVRAKTGLQALGRKGFQKNEYQSDFMAQKRLRTGRAARIENMGRPPRDQLRGDARLTFERTVQAQWKKQLDALIDKARTAGGGARLKKDVLDNLRSRFWAGVDTALDEKEVNAKRPV